VKPGTITPETTIGIDLGLTTFITTSDGTKTEPCKALSRYEAKLKKQQRWLSRKQRGSKNYQKQRIKVAKTHEKVSNTRSHFLHNITKKLTSDNQTVGTIVLEDLSVRSMMKNQRLAKAIGDASWTMFINQLAYKAQWYGVNLLRIGRYEPSSKLCSVCATINRELTLKDRTWVCQNCSSVHDRDINAAINIKAIGLADQNRVGWSSPELTLGETRTLVQSKNQEQLTVKVG
jgi:putative transposase